MRAIDLEPWDVETAFDHVGASIERAEAAEKVTGGARYSTDVRLAGQLFAAIVRSGVASGRVTGIDVTKAWSVDGVVDVLTAADVDGETWYGDEVPLLAGTVRFVGDEVAVVAGTSIEAARRGAAAIEVSYEPSPHATDLDEIERGEAPVVLGATNLVGDIDQIDRGDAPRAIDGAAHVVEGTYRTPVAVHNALEPHTCTAVWDASGVTLYCSTQGVNDVREEMARRLGLPHSQVRVIAEHIGGGFGAKQVPWKPTMFAAILARRTGRPVQVALDRRGENLAAGKRGRSRQSLRIGADDNGRLSGIEATLVDDIGAYQIAGEASALEGPAIHLYACEDVRVTRKSIRSNTGPAVAFRAPGYVEATFALESAMDELARALAIDPIELRRINHVGFDQQTGRPWSQPDGILWSYDLIEQSRTWTVDGRDPGDLAPGIVRGRGFAAHDWVAASASPPGHASVLFNFDGSVSVQTSAQDIGTGVRTVLTQVAAEELMMEPERIRLTLGDTAAGPPAPTSSGSSTVPTMAPGVRAAARDAIDRLLDVAARHLDVQRSSLVFHGTSVEVLRGHRHRLDDLLSELSPVVIQGWGGRETTASEVSVRAQGSAAAAVEVDIMTGEIRVVSITVAPDCGRILNHRLADSQVIGGVTQGIGFALTEEQTVDDRLGIVCNPDLNEYLVPTVTDLGPIRHARLDRPDLAANALGVKGIGELPMIAVPAAIANAVRDATGLRFTELPLTRRRVLDALAANAGKEPPVAKARSVGGEAR